MRNHLLLITACLLITGCATHKSRDDMVSEVKIFERVCSSELSAEEAARRLQAAWTACFVTPSGVNIVPIGQTIAVYQRSRIIITSEQVDTTKVLIARLPPPGFGMPLNPMSNAIFLMADIRETNECRSEIVVRATNSYWEKRSTQTRAWLENPGIMPKEAECKR
jgi:hypothetical protein